MKAIGFIKTNSYDIFKMFLNQIGLSIFALVMSVATYNNDTLFLLTGLMSIGIYLYLLYTMTYEIGRKDKPAVDAGRKKPQYAKGLMISLCANALNIILVLCIVISSYTLVKNPNYIPPSNETETTVQTSDTFSENKDDGFATSETTSEYIKTFSYYVYVVSFSATAFLQATYLSVKQKFFENSHLIYLLYPVPALITCWLAYFIGLKGKRILFFLPEKPQKPKNI